MTFVNIQLPSELYVALYQKFGEKTQNEIERLLNSALSSEAISQPQVGQHSSKRPKPHTISGQVWAIADELFEQTGTTPERIDVLTRCGESGINNNTTNTQFSHWKRNQIEHGTISSTREKQRMSKYEPIEHFLATSKLDEITLSFKEISNNLGVNLPQSAFTHREWWSNQRENQNRPQAKAWMSKGYKVDSVNQDQDSGWVIFLKID